MTHDTRRHGASVRTIPLALLISATLGLSVCASLGDRRAPAMLRDAPSLGLPVAAPTPVTLDNEWWRAFGDVPLDGLVAQALADNPSLNIAQARLRRAQAGVELTEAASGPQLSAALDATQQQFTANGAIPPPLDGSVRDSGTAQLNASWELDFFGKNRAATSRWRG